MKVQKGCRLVLNPAARLVKIISLSVRLSTQVSALRNAEWIITKLDTVQFC